MNESLRFAEAGDAFFVPVAGQVQHFHGVISQGSDEQPMALEVGGKVVDSSVHAGHLDRRYELQRQFVRSVPKRTCHRERQKQNRLQR